MMLAGGNIKRYYIRSKRIVLQKYQTGQDQSSRVIYWKWAFSWAHLLAEIILYIFSSSVLIIAVNISSNAIKLLSFWRVFKSKKVVKSVSYFSHYHKDLALCVRSWKFFRMKIRETNIKKIQMGPQCGPVCCGENMITTSEGLLHSEFVLWKQQTVFCKYLGKSSLGQILAKINITHSASMFSWTCLTKASTTAVLLCQMYLYLKPLLQLVFGFHAW